MALATINIVSCWSAQIWHPWPSESTVQCTANSEGTKASFSINQPTKTWCKVQQWPQSILSYPFRYTQALYLWPLEPLELISWPQPIVSSQPPCNAWHCTCFFQGLRIQVRLLLLRLPLLPLPHVKHRPLGWMMDRWWGSSDDSRVRQSSFLSVF